MQTRRLYYEDCHLAQFSAQVLSCVEAERGWLVTLDATAFYPEGGGQACDVGTLGGVNVRDVRERDGAIVHLCDVPLAPGATVEGKIDYDHRFHLMQQHSGEHIVSGIIHARYGYHNVGFHMGAEGMVIDFDGVVPPQEIRQIEWEANRAVWKNLEIRAWYPPEAELATLAYRTKKALAYPVRIVEIPGYDRCACCGVHVAATGEIGVIKLLSAVGLRGGTRIEMLCGEGALAALNTAFDQNRLVSQAFSASWQDTGAAAARMNEMLETERAHAGSLYRRIFAGIASGYEGSGNVLHFEQGFSSAQVRELADTIAERCNALAAVFSGDDETGYAYALVTRTGDITDFASALNETLCGRGGGKKGFRQGSVRAKRKQIEAFFAAKS